jgi:hypothetical protein
MLPIMLGVLERQPSPTAILGRLLQALTADAQPAEPEPIRPPGR